MQEYLSLITDFYSNDHNKSALALATEFKNLHPDCPVSIQALRRRYFGNLIKGVAMSNSDVEPPKHSANILIFDIETAPIRAYIWSKWQKGVGDSQIITDWFILCWSAKWLFNDKIESMKVTPEECLAGNDKRIVEGLWQKLDEADIIIAHNLNKFDRKKTNTRFLKHGMMPPSSYQCIDTLIHARKNFAITSNRLDYIATKFLGIKGKIETKQELWNRCMLGEKKALNEMSVYCDQDIRVLEDVYLYLRPWINPHPNVGLHVGSSVAVCPRCASNDLSWNSEYHTYVHIYDEYKCNDCGGIGRSRRATTQRSMKERIVKTL